MCGEETSGIFVQYTGMVNSFLPARMIPALPWMATCAEIFGLCLILGIYRRAVATGSAALLLMFAWAMSVSFGVKSAIDYAVFSASSAAFLLVAMCQMAAGKNKTEKSAG
jgi:putative oxidoreductase